ncbi:hephaestin-like [Mytilus trossulus]|uniref:hephaestin-like n=1 Tax=Mytilus trossulus TaxID=6551 RepID=UPI003005EE2F
MVSSVLQWSILISIFSSICCIRRDYFITAEEQWWDYAPSKQNLITNDRTISDRHIQTTEDRIGSVYKKVMLKQFTDGYFRREIKPAPWMGYIGPTIKGETGDVLYIHFRNLASRPYGLHPHGVQYFKDSEGSLYMDGTSGRDKLDDSVPPGETYTYRWSMLNSFAPTEDDDNCIPVGYHPHIRSNKDIDTGLVGILLICKPGILNPDNSRKDVDREFVLYADTVNETNSWLIEESLNLCLNPQRCRQLFNEKNAAFIGDTLMYSINGYIYGNLPDFPVHEGERVAFYAMGLNLGLHVFGVQGQSLTFKGKRTHAVVFGIAWFEGFYMTAINPGRWMIFCKVNYHFNHGMAAFVNVVPRPGILPPTILRRTRRYFIAVEEVVWDYRPSGRVLARVGKGSAERSTIEERFFTSGGAVGGRFVKAVFIEYTDGTFERQKKRCKDEKHLGILGPPVRVEVGEMLEIILLNKASRPYSFSPFGVAFTKDNEGAFYKNDRHSSEVTGAAAMPGQQRRYIFTVPWDYGPTKEDPQCVTETYQSFVDYARDQYSGLIGPLLICKPGSLNAEGRQRGVNKELFLTMMNWFEQDSWYFNQSISLAMMNGKMVDQENAMFRDVNTLRAINGRVFGNIGGFDMCIGDRVSWHVLGFGERFDYQNPVFEGNNVQYDGKMVDYVTVFPGTSQTAYMAPDNPGNWLIHAGQLQSQTDGMVTRYNVDTCNRPLFVPVPGFKKITVRRYYIAAVDVIWDYAPRKINIVTMGDLRDPNTPGNLYVRDTDMFIGTQYKKTVYREFYDGTFSRQIQRTEKDNHLGILGPFIKAAVGDVIEIVFKNMASFDNSIYLKNLPLDNAMSKHLRNGVKPGDVKVYSWGVPERSGPGRNEPNCVGYSYNSPVYPQKDIATGLIGPLLICKRGVLDVYGNRMDKTNREFALAFVIFNEADSHYFDENVRVRAPNRMNRDDSMFQQSNNKFSINGFIFSNIPNLEMVVGDTIAWYTYSFGNSNGVHSNHFHGQTFIKSSAESYRDDVIGVVPGSYETVEMFADNPGTWFVHCHLGLHMSAGMMDTYTILPKNLGDINRGGPQMLRGARIGRELRRRNKFGRKVY